MQQAFGNSTIQESVISIKYLKPDSCDQFDPNTVTKRLGERSVAGDDRRLHRLRKSDVYGVVCTHVAS